MENTFAKAQRKRQNRADCGRCDSSEKNLCHNEREMRKELEGQRSRSEAQRRNAGESRNPGKSGFARQGKMRPKKRRENSSPSLYTNLKIVYTFRIFCFMR